MHTYPVILLRLTMLALAAVGWSTASKSTQAQDVTVLAGRGLALLSTYCGTCHAIGSTGESARAEAPAFRDVVARRGRDEICRFLSRGMKASHPAMPRYDFDEQDIASLLVYLDTLRLGTWHPEGDCRTRDAD